MKHAALFHPFARPSGAITGDTFPIFRDGVCHLFHMQMPHLAHHVSRDLIHWEERSMVVLQGTPAEPDHNVATGTVLEHAGKYYCFYTGNQNACLATSDDLETWTKHPLNPLVAGDGVHFEKANFRDPFVFWNKQEKCWWMLLGVTQTH